MGEIRKLEQERLVLPRLPTEGAGQGLEPTAVGATGVSAGAVERSVHNSYNPGNS